MHIKATFLLFLTLFTVKISFAQSTAKDTVTDAKDQPKPFILKPTIGLGAGMFSYRGDIINKRLGTNFITNIGYELYLEQILNNSFSFRFQYITGKLSANERSYAQQLNFQSTIHSGGINLLYNFSNFLSEEHGMEPYIFVGVESFEFLSKTDLYDSKGNYYNYWSDGSIRNIAENSPDAGKSVMIKRDYTYESDLREGNLDKLGKYQERSWAIPFGFGANFKISDRVNLKIGSAIHYTFTDLIDNVSSKGTGNRKGDSKNDKFIFSSFSVSYDLTNPKDKEMFLYPPATRDELLAADSGDYDGDGVADILDKEGLTHADATIDEHGVGIDSDKDGIQDHKDEEKESAANAVVDTKGVTLTDDLMQLSYDMYTDSTGRFAKVEKMPDAFTKGMFASNTTPAQEGKFTVMVGNFKTGVPPELINKYLSINDINSKTTPDSATIYTVGKYPYYNAALARKAEMVNKGIKDATIIVWNGDKYVAIDENNYKEYEPKAALAISGSGAELEGGETININKGGNKENIKNTGGNKGTVKSDGKGTENAGKAIEALSDKPDQIVYRVQLGAYRKPLSSNVFRGVGNVIAVPTQDGLTRYLTGQYNNFNDAAKQKIDMISKGFPGAFVVVYKGGKRISLAEAGVKTVSNTPENTAEEESNSADKTQVVFKVQIGVFKADAPADLKAKIANMQNVETSTTATGLKRYTVGSFSNYAEAQAKKKALQEAGIKDAFIIAFFKDNLIDISEALELLK